jgi:hypothetical protein
MKCGVWNRNLEYGMYGNIHSEMEIWNMENGEWNMKIEIAMENGKGKWKNGKMKHENMEMEMENGKWNMENGKMEKWKMEWKMKQNMEYGIWNMEYGIWNMEYGIWNWNMKYERIWN